MRARERLAGLGFAGVLLLASVPARAQAPVARPLLEQLQQVGLDVSSSYRVNDIYLRRDAARLHLQHGTLVFLEPVGGRITGAVFEGTGEALVVPPQQEERQQLLKFTGSPILAESFANTYLRFTDDTYAELISQIRAGRGRPLHSPEVAERWQPLVAPLNRMHSVRVLLDFVQTPPRPYFYAAISGHRLGNFDVMVDARRSEQVFVGQLRWEKEQRYYDVWCSFARREPAPVEAGADVRAYRIHTRVNPDRTLEAEAVLEVEVRPAGGQMLVFHLARSLEVIEVAQLDAGAEAEAARQLEFIQDISPGDEEAGYRGSDYVLVLLPPPETTAGSVRGERRLRFRYRGSVIGEAGAGVFYVQARDTWYPSLDQSAPARYELRFRYPSSLELVAAGERRDYREDGQWKEGTWVMDVPLPLAGFNLGNFERRDFGEEPARVSVYSNRQMEPRLARALRLALEAPLPAPPRQPRSPAAALEGPAPVFEVERVGGDVSEALAYFTRLFGAVPYGGLQVSPLPGRLAQGYPGLLYLSTLSYLSESDLSRLGLDDQTREQLAQLMPAHETAHQWWGNWLWTLDYRDQWLGEALASYSALLFWEGQRGDASVRRRWLERYRANLLALDESGRAVAATGALSLGPRLNSSHSPAGYVMLAYNKGPWVIHMLRELFRNPETGSDELFFRVLRELVAGGGERPLNSEEFQRRLEAVLPDYADVENTGRLDWFFQQWVHDIGIPRYRLRWAFAGNNHEACQVKGTIEQSEVSDLFTMPVGVYARTGEELRLLGRVVVTGGTVAFCFPASAPPDELLLDPFQSVLFVPEPAAAP